MKRKETADVLLPEENAVDVVRWKERSRHSRSVVYTSNKLGFTIYRNTGPVSSWESKTSINFTGCSHTNSTFPRTSRGLMLLCLDVSLYRRSTVPSEASFSLWCFNWARRLSVGWHTEDHVFYYVHLLVQVTF